MNRLVISLAIVFLSVSVTWGQPQLALPETLEAARIKVLKGAHAEGRAEIDGVLDTGPSQQEAEYGQYVFFESYFIQGDYANAVREGDQFLDQFADSGLRGDVTYLRALALLLNRQYAEAETAFIEFRTEFPKHHRVDNALFMIAESYYARDEIERAIELLEQLIQEHPGSDQFTNAYLKISLICREALSEAHETAMAQGVDVSEETRSKWIKKADWAVEQAATAPERALAYWDGEDFGVVLELTRFVSRHDLVEDKAVEYLTAHPEANNERVTVLARKGMAQYHQGKVADAIVTLEQAAASSPTFEAHQCLTYGPALAMFQLVEAERKRGNAAKAKEWLKKLRDEVSADEENRAKALTQFQTLLDQ